MLKTLKPCRVTRTTQPKMSCFFLNLLRFIYRNTDGCLRFRIGWRGESRSASPRAARVGAGAAVERVVDPLGTVVAPRRAPRAPPLDDPDSYTSSNADEATFRPVVRAPANIPLHPDMVVRPLPRNTTIPVQTISPVGSLSPEDEPVPLNTDVVIPAALTNVREWLSDQETETRITSKVDVVEAADESVKVEVSEEKAVVVETIAEKEDAAVKIEKTTVQKDTEPKNEKTVKPRQSDYKESVTEGYNPIIEKEKSPKLAKQVEYDTAASEIKKPTVQDTPKVEKPSRRKDSPPELAKSTVPKETDKIFEQKVSVFKTDKLDEKNTATWLDKSFAQKDITAKLDNSTKQKDNKTEKPIGRKDDADKYVKPAKQAVDERKTTQPDSVDRVNVDVKRNDVNKDLKRQDDVRKGDSARERSSVECAERESDDSKSLPKSNRQPDDIQPTARIRVKKSPTPKSVSDTDSEVSLKDKSKKIEDFKELKENKEIKETKEIKKQKEIREHKYIKETKEVKSRDSVDKTVVPIIKDDELSVEASFKLPQKKEFTESKTKKRVEPEIKTEEQAWDMLLSEPEKPLLLNSGQQTTVNDKTDDKPKTKKNRKLKKSQEDMQEKADEDSFVEIHAIEEKQQPCSGELVSISTPFEDVEHMSYLSKAKKPRSPKSFTPEKRDEFERKSIDFLSHEAFETASKLKPGKYDTYDISDIEVFSDASYSQKQREVKDTFNTTSKAKKYAEVSSSETSFVVKESKPSKSKSLSPYPEWRKVDKPIDVAEKDVYVINTTEDDFPEIQITRGTKPRKRSPLPAERKSLEKEPVIDKPIKSWSSIAASKNDKKDVERKVETVENKFDKKKDELKDDSDTDENKMSSTISLQEKLFELCKRTDIMVAECDTPSELNFVEEHHAVLHDLPPLEPLDFGLDDFKLEVMRDSLLEVNDAKITSPICKINIDDILSSIKETTAKVIESSTFNLIDLEKVPAKKEKGFSVIESHKITSQEVKIDDDKPETEVMEKSSDEDITSPVVSTDSDKDDKKIAGASNSILPSSKQSAKSKKSRRKKK